MNVYCNICATALSGPIYQSPEKVSVTSLCEIRPERTTVFFCDRCGHLQTQSMCDLVQYYDHDYRILIDTEEEDQLYVRADGSKTFRTAHQVATLLDKVAIPHAAKVLDFGCAKSSTLRQLCQDRSDIQPHAFDVSDMYVPFWDKFIPVGQWATHSLPEEWQNSFDVVMSYFALEHVAEPRDFVSAVGGLLKEGGIFYCIVPNVYANSADFVVADHVNHFSAQSLTWLLNEGGFDVLDLDDQAHTSAWVVTAHKNAARASGDANTQAISILRLQVAAMTNYWRQFGRQVQDFESAHSMEIPSAIYGSGFYGTFIATCLRNLENVVCFLDQNPHRQKHTLFGRPVLPPASLPDLVRTIYVGLNPLHARAVIESVAGWRSGKHSFFFP